MTSTSNSSNWPPAKKDLARLLRALTYAQVADLFGVAVEDVVALEWEYSGTVKGNITGKGERIYHVPGGPHYDQTGIDTAKGERWFGSENEARAAGWRKPARRRSSAPAVPRTWPTRRRGADPSCPAR